MQNVVTICLGFWILHEIEFFNFFYHDNKFLKLHVSTKLSVWVSQKQKIYFLKEKIPIHILFLFFFTTMNEKNTSLDLFFIDLNARNLITINNAFLCVF